ncbi:MAG: phosphate ABC transporter substrate-binding protein PstS [Deltaproteobacteria bacterium RIFCSPLOWO2_12_FULL_43_16]|nr:MAG: phosphate ABC transporter substrate-binding protein PstS [Deltaproteobacteria bacterium RIFCSPHIGHO2_02_FULL_43_33]OGQ59103.1 MAG: phosphate ABC transporter substrate-binding protein PstS [Deltaproteobacteria bacterium RIFCSPLOWO2_12_FULL_43_16]HBR17187.1 phosphate ABC transporter substrate-binding protein PstS [Deltaproteobacteria bacterium]
MKRLIVCIALAISLLVSGKGFAADTLNGAGATFPYPLYSAWAYSYEKETGVRLNYQSIGSGGGVRQIVNRTVDFGASDDALKPEDMTKDSLLQWPQVIGGIVLVVNVAGIKSEEMTLDANAVCSIFLGNIKKWNDPALSGLNPKLNLPNKEITVVHRSDGSGTTAVFTHYLDETCKSWHDKVGYGKSVEWPAGIGGKGNEGVANYVKRVADSIGYVEFAYAKQNNLAYILLKNPAGNVVKPTLESFAEAAASGDFNPETHFYTWVTNAKGPGAWPITAATNILLAKDKAESNKKVVKFFEWTFSAEADKTAKDLVYAPLPDALKKKVREYWKANGLY